MKICWSNIEDIYLSIHGNFRYKNMTYIEKEACVGCGEPYLTKKSKDSDYCTRSCSLKNNAYWLGKKMPLELRNKVIKTLIYNKKVHGPMYSTYGHQLSLCEEIRNFSGFLEVKCAYCGNWFVPTIVAIKCRIEVLKGQRTGEARFYCSKHCKKACPTYRQVKYPKGFKKATSREVQPELRQLVLKRDNYSCQYDGCCKTTENSEIHCHHKEGIRWNPIESADIDMCISLCKEHHKLVHKKQGCRYVDLQCKD